MRGSTVGCTRDVIRYPQREGTKRVKNEEIRLHKVELGNAQRILDTAMGYLGKGGVPDLEAQSHIVVDLQSAIRQIIYVVNKILDDL